MRGTALAPPLPEGQRHLHAPQMLHPPLDHPFPARSQTSITCSGKREQQGEDGFDRTECLHSLTVGVWGHGGWEL